jgi:RNA recognition motif-containing protein
MNQQASDLPNTVYSTNSIVVSNFNDETTEDDLIKHFVKFGIVTCCKIFFMDQIRFAIINFRTVEMAENAIFKAYEIPFNGQLLFAEPADLSLYIKQL